MSATELARWVGRRERRADWITPAGLAAWRATLDRPHEDPADGDPAPCGFHWTLFPPLARESALGEEGHPRAGEFLPPVRLPRRMWAGSRVVCHRPLRVGQRVERESTVAAAEEKDGRRGPLVLVTVHHVISDTHGVAVEEDQDIVYVGGRVAGAAPTPPSERLEREATWRRTVRPSSTLLFRYSALTFNAHRIHYDRDYATAVEGYPGLVVHGPLVATLLLDLLDAERPGADVERFRFRAVRPTFDISPLQLSGSPGDDDRHFRLWSTDDAGHTAVEAEAWIR